MLNKKMTMEATVHKIRDFDIDKYHQQLQKKNQQITSTPYHHERYKRLYKSTLGG